MTGIITISLDGMGGDDAPDVVVAGAELALKRFPDLRFLLFGEESRLAPLLTERPRVAAACELRHTPDVVSAEAKAGHALRRGRGSSMGLAIKAVREGEAAAAVSAGNTGALMAMAKFMLRTMPGIDRPALVGTFPTIAGRESVVLDLGANVECDENNLVQFAVMGAEYARAVLGRERPTIGLLNVGVEDGKGSATVRAAGERLKSVPDTMEFAGYVEGDGIISGNVDVIVTDGFTGNAALKAAEGTARMFVHFMSRGFRKSIFTKLGYLLSIPAIRYVKVKLDPRRYNGAVFLGLNGLVVKSHGSTDAIGFANAICTAVNMAKQDICARILEDLPAFGTAREGETAPAVEMAEARKRAQS